MADDLHILIELGWVISPAVGIHVEDSWPPSERTGGAGR